MQRKFNFSRAYYEDVAFLYIFTWNTGLLLLSNSPYICTVACGLCALFCICVPFVVFMLCHTSSLVHKCGNAEMETKQPI